MKFAICAVLAVAAVTLSACGGGDAAFRSAVAGQCETQLKANPATPAGLDIKGACSCASEKAFGGKTNVSDYAQTPEGQQALGLAVAQCLAERMGIPSPTALPGAAAPTPGEATPATPHEENEAE